MAIPQLERERECVSQLDRRISSNLIYIYKSYVNEESLLHAKVALLPE